MFAVKFEIPSPDMASTSEMNANRQTAENEDRIFDFSVSDFSRIVKTTFFQDKSLMIRDVFNSSSRILITAPGQFGKSTNIDMIKRFLEIGVDSMTGIIKPVNTTENYKLFKGNNLYICKDKEFFNEHFGKHPVIHIDCELLGRLSGSVSMVERFRTIIRSSFNQHRYLLVDEPDKHCFVFGQSRPDGFNNKKIFYEDDNFDENNFRSFFSEKHIGSIAESSLPHGFKYLSTVLSRFFEKKVFVLLDNYHAFINGMLLSGSMNPERDKVISFVDTMITDLLENSPYVGQVLLTGILPVAEDRFFFHRNKVECYSVTDSNNRFSKYYGLTSAELDKSLKKILKDDGERNKTEQMINEYYGYIRENEHSKMYSIWSVLQYLHRGKVDGYWCNGSSSCFSNSRVKCLFKNSWIMKKVLLLLMNDELCITDTLQPLSTKDVLQFNNIIASGKCEAAEDIPPQVVNTFFYMLCHFGYLSISEDLGRGSVKVKIPNKEIKLELAKLVLF